MPQNMVQLGVAISFLPRTGVRRGLDSGSVSLIYLADTLAVFLITYLLLRRNEHHDTAVVAFLKLLRETYEVTISIHPVSLTYDG